MNFGDLIHARRVALNLSLEDIGKAVGVKKQTVMKWEKGIIKNMRRDKILSLAKVLQIPPEQLIDTRYWDDTTTFSMYGDTYSSSSLMRKYEMGEPLIFHKEDDLSLSASEINLINLFRTLNARGKQAVMDHLQIVCGNPDLLASAPPSSEKKVT